MKDIIIYTDGACKNNPGPGGYAGVILHTSSELSESKIVKEIVGGDNPTTNNIMELTAILESLKYVYSVITREENISKLSKEKNMLNVKVYTDSEYSLKGILEWHISWEKKGYNKVKNAELWKELITVIRSLKSISGINFEVFKVKGHSGDKFNDLVDKLASDEAIRQSEN